MSDFDVLSSKYAGRWIVITGIRDLDYPIARGIVVHKMTEVVQGRPLGIVFGGARGVDTLALRAAWLARGGADAMMITPKLVAVVPDSVDRQPRTAAHTIRDCADEVIELHLPIYRAGSFHKRNEHMLLLARERSDGLPQAPLCIGFTDNVDPRSGGTASTMSLARRLVIEVEHVPTPRVQGGAD